MKKMNKRAFVSKRAVAKTVAAALTMTPAVMMGPTILGAPETAQAADPAMPEAIPPLVVFNPGQHYDFSSQSWYASNQINHWSVSSSRLGSSGSTWQPSIPGTYTIYFYTFDIETYDEVYVGKTTAVVNFHRITADENKDGLIDIAEIVKYMATSPADFSVSRALQWIDLTTAEPNHAPAATALEFPRIELYPDEDTVRYALKQETPQSTFLYYFEDPDHVDYEKHDYLSYQIVGNTESAVADTKLLYEKIAITPKALGTESLILRAYDEHGVYADRPLTVSVVENKTPVWRGASEKFSVYAPDLAIPLNEFFFDEDMDTLVFTLAGDYSATAFSNLEIRVGMSGPELYIEDIAPDETTEQVTIKVEDSYGNIFEKSIMVTLNENYDVPE